jgi:hypothetical protein
VFDGQGQLVALATEVEVGVAPTVQFAGTAQGLARAQGGAILFGMVDQEHGQMELALELAQEAQQGSDL